MRQRNSLLLALLLGIVLSLTPAWAQENPPKDPPLPEQVQQPAQPQAWAGDLVDAGCRISAPNDKCEVTETTKLFGLQTPEGKYYRFDGDSNTKVLTALKSSDKRTGAIKVSINGSLNGEELKVETVQIR